MKFRDGSILTITYPDELFSNTFVMTLKQETVGQIEINDAKHNLKCLIKFGTVSREPTDFLEGFIVENNKKIISKLRGSYLGFLEFDGVRYWDAREVNAYDIKVVKSLPSDSDNRPDLIFLKNQQMEEAQLSKEKLEEAQRNDRKLRESYKNKK